MQLGTRPPPGTGMTVLSTRVNGSDIAGVDGNPALLSDIDFSDPVAVESARSTILQMTVWDDFVGNAFRHGCEPEARIVLADTVLLLKAAAWEKDFFCKVLADGLAPEDLLAAQVRLFSLLSPQGLRAMTAKHEVTAEGIRYTPDTGNAGVDGLLRMVVSADVIDALRRLGPAVSEVADTLDAHARAWRMAGPGRAEAQGWEQVAWMAEMEQNHDAGARAMEKAATAWETADQSGIAVAHAWRCAAGHLRDAGQFDRAAQVYERAARIYEAAGLHGQQATAYRNAAWSWDAAGQDKSAAQTQEMEAMAWEIADQSDVALAEALDTAGWRWKTAGLLVRAAQSFEKAASLYDAAGRLEKVADTCGQAASCRDDAGQGARAATGWAKAAAAWEVVHNFQMAAECWRKAGSPGQQVRAWKLALQDASAEAEQEILMSGTPLFRFDMEFEGALRG